MAWKYQDLKILCIDDNRHMHQIYWISLNSMGFRDVTTAIDGKEAARHLENGTFDIILCDIAMKEMDGIAFVKSLRSSSDADKREIPVIMVSGNASRENIEAARDVGANEFLTKPVSVQNLFKRIDNVLKNPRAFVETGDFAGPDRRRKNELDFVSERRCSGKAQA